MVDLRGKAVLVIGAGGIGCAIIQALAKHNLEKLGVIDMTKEPNPVLGEITKDIKCSYRQAAVDDKEALSKAMSEVSADLGGLEIIINSAGILDEQNYAKMISVNYGGVVNSTLTGIEIMRKDRGGKGGLIINIASLSAFGSYFILPIYAGTKAAVLSLTRSLVNEAFYDKTGVSFVSICPGVTSTAMLGTYTPDKFAFPDMAELILTAGHAVPQQPPSVVGDTVVKALENAQNGDVWVCNDSKIEKILVPEYPFSNK